MTPRSLRPASVILALLLSLPGLAQAPCPLPKRATLNPLPAASAFGPCAELPALYIADVDAMTRSVEAAVGDEVGLGVYVRNGADPAGTPEEAIARDVRVAIAVDTARGASHRVAVTMRGANTNTVTSEVTIRTPERARLELVPQSGMQYDIAPLAVSWQLELGNNTISLGDLRPGWEDSQYLTFSVRVVDGETENAEARNEDVALASPAVNRRRALLWYAWNAVNEKYYDPSFGGVDWQGMYDEYLPKMDAIQTDDEAYLLIQEMFNRLGRSHVGILQPEYDAPSGDVEEEPPAPTPAAAGVGGIGLDFRFLDGAAVVTRVALGSAAEKAGIRMGHILEAIDDEPIAEIAAEITAIRGYGPMVKDHLPIILAMVTLNGAPGTRVRVTFRDGDGGQHTADIERQPLPGQQVELLGVRDVAYYEAESRMLTPDVGYVRFTAFVVPTVADVCAALHAMKNARGIVLDLRGNFGGILEAVLGVASMLERDYETYGFLRARNGTQPISVGPAPFQYRGNIVVLIDRTSVSSAELLAYGLGRTRRAVLVGERTSGQALGTTFEELWNGAHVAIPIMDIETGGSGGIEGVGVAPHVAVALDRAALLQGVDNQLRVATQIATDPRRAAARPAETARMVIHGAPDEPTPPATAMTEPLPSAYDLVAQYLAAVNAPAGLRVRSRISKGTIANEMSGIQGTVELYERAPHTSVMFTDIAGIGTMQSGYDGKRGWFVSPFGFSILGGREGRTAGFRRQYDFHRLLRLRDHYSRMKTIRRETLAERPVYVVQAHADDGEMVHLSFDAQSKLLVGVDEDRFDDYRSVDGVLLPFRLTTTLLGYQTTLTLTAIEQNVAIPEDKLRPLPSCLAQ